MGQLGYTTAEIQSILDKFIAGEAVANLAGTSFLNPTELIDINTYYPVIGIFTDHGMNTRFVTNPDGSVEYTGSTIIKAIINGTSDCLVNKACKLTYGMFKNGVVIVGAETPHDFTFTSKEENLSITSIIQINPGDIFRVYAKSSAANTTLTPSTLNVTFHEI